MSTLRDTYGMACPNCGNHEMLRILLETMAELTPNGTEPYGHHEWSPNSWCFCDRCHHSGTVADFSIDTIPNVCDLAAEGGLR